MAIHWWRTERLAQELAHDGVTEGQSLGPGSHFQKVKSVLFTTFDIAAGLVREIGLDFRYIRKVQSSGAR